MALGRLQKAWASENTRPAPFVGAGVASAVTGGAACASWHGLLLDGIEQCQQRVPVPTGWANRMREHLASADAISYMAVADEIRRRLAARAEGRDFSSWLQESVGSLTPTKEGWELLSAIRSLGEMIVTTNYDTLLEGAGPEPALHPEWDALTWIDNQWKSAAIRQKVVLHLHGIADKPESVILSSTDYQRILDDKLDKIVSQYVFLSRRFLYIGCGDGLGDPHIAPLMRWVIEALTAQKDQKQQEDEEHFLLVRGGELHQLMTDPLSERVSPVAYGAKFDQLADFLRKLSAGLELKVSQNPDDYEPIGSAASAVAPAPGPFGWTDEAGNPAEKPVGGARGAVPPVTALSLQALEDQRVQEAYAAVRRAARAMDRVAGCVALPIGMTTWDPADQLTVHDQLAVSAASPTASLRDRLRQAADAVAAATNQATKIGAQTEPGPTLVPGRIAPMVAALEALSAELAERVTLLHEDLRRRSTTSSIRYRRLLSDLEDAQAEADALSGAAQLRQLLARRPERGVTGIGRWVGGAGQQGAGQASTVGADPRAGSPRQAEATVAPVTDTELSAQFLQPTGVAAGGPGTDRELPDADPVPVTSSLANDEVIVVLVTGESMAGDNIHDGNYLVVDTRRDIADGDIAVFEKEGVGQRERFVKRVYGGEAEAYYRSSSPDSLERTMTVADQPLLIGKVIAVLRTIG